MNVTKPGALADDGQLERNDSLREKTLSSTQSRISAGYEGFQGFCGRKTAPD
jgi:hypothetical protein